MSTFSASSYLFSSKAFLSRCVNWIWILRSTFFLKRFFFFARRSDRSVIRGSEIIHLYSQVGISASGLLQVRDARSRYLRALFKWCPRAFSGSLFVPSDISGTPKKTAAFWVPRRPSLGWPQFSQWLRWFRSLLFPFSTPRPFPDPQIGGQRKSPNKLHLQFDWVRLADQRCA